MSENEQSSTRSDNWITVSQAAAALGKSERTTRRMCESGTLSATMQANESGGRAWFIELASVERAAISERAANGRAAMRPNDAATSKVTARAQIERENLIKPKFSLERAAKDDRADNVRPNDAAILLREKDARIDDLRAQVESQKLQIEAANRQAAEATAALREYLKLQAKALPSGTPESTSSTRSNAIASDEVVSRENAPQAPINDEAAKDLSSTRNDAQKAAKREMRAREMRPLWKVILGVR